MKKIFALILLALAAPAALALGGLGGNAEPELLSPEVAFKFQAQAVPGDQIQLQWDIAKGYYLYRDKFDISVVGEGITLQGAQYPKGKIKHDEFFGDVEIYRGKMRVTVPFTRSAEAPGAIKLQARFQGCADMGVCYPPQTVVSEIALPPPSPSSSTATGATANPINALSSFANSIGGANDELLDPDQAFRLELSAKDDNTLVASWVIADAYYLYKDKFKFSLKDATGARLGTPRFPQGIVKNDEFFGRIEVFKHNLSVEIPLLREAGAQGPLTLVAQYQGCAELGVCYPPISKTLAFEISELPKARTVAATTALATSAPSATGTQTLSEQDSFAKHLASSSTLLSLLLLYIAGLGLAFTPCVFPMIPILSGIIVGQGSQISRSKAFMLSLAYVLGMALTYTVVGVFVGLSGENVQAWFQNPWVLGVFAAIFVLLSFSMFGFYELQMPASVQSRLTSLSNKQEGGRLGGAAIMGFLSALIVGPCVTAPLIGVLIYISQTADAFVGGLALFALSMGMGTPLLLFGTAAGELLPKAGAWMNVVKAIFGALLIGVAIWLIERVLPDAVTMTLWAVYIMVIGIYMGALEPIKAGASGWMRLWKGLGIIALIYGVLLLIGMSGGSNNLTQPLKGLQFGGGSGGPTTQAEGPRFEAFKGTQGLAAILERAQASGKPVMLDFFADWCVSCKEMEKYTFAESSVMASLDDFIIVQADVTANDELDQALLKQFGIFGPPAILFFTPDGTELSNARVVGYMAAQKFAAHLETVKRQ